MKAKIPLQMRRGALAIALVVGLWLTVPAAAMASRAPTASERSAIVHAAHATVAPTQRIRVSDIRVSTAGPWALATVTTYLRRTYPRFGQTGYESFYDDHGRWLEAEEIGVPEEMPHAVEKDLGLVDSGGGAAIHTYLAIYLLACWFFGLSALIDVALQPRRAFRAIGETKSRWLVVELLGLPFLGVFTWAYYALRIRPAIVEAGGHKPRRLLRAIRWLLTPEEGEAQASPQRHSAPTHSPPSSQQAQPCTSCGGRGRIMCTNCGGRGQIPNPNPHSGSSALVGCPACGAQRGGRLCSTCGGSGKRR